MTREDPSVRTAAPDQTRAFTSPMDEKTHTPSVRVKAGADKGDKYVVGKWGDLPLYGCPAPQDVCQFTTLDGDQAVQLHYDASHPTDWLAEATGEEVDNG